MKGNEVHNLLMKKILNDPFPTGLPSDVLLLPPPNGRKLESMLGRIEI
ncbi:MAG: hypothetical protein ABR985_02545 [Methanotrichaceae archaeon]|jgi:hypothetical protein